MKSYKLIEVIEIVDTLVNINKQYDLGKISDKLWELHTSIKKGDKL